MMSHGSEEFREFGNRKAYLTFKDSWKSSFKTKKLTNVTNRHTTISLENLSATMPALGVMWKLVKLEDRKPNRTFVVELCRIRHDRVVSPCSLQESESCFNFPPSRLLFASMHRQSGSQTACCENSRNTCWETRCAQERLSRLEMAFHLIFPSRSTSGYHFVRIWIQRRPLRVQNVLTKCTHERPLFTGAGNATIN